jgi:hypothetical protein
LRASDIENLVKKIIAKSKEQPFYYYDLLKVFPSTPYRDIMIAWGKVREQIQFDRDETSHYVYPKRK